MNDFRLTQSAQDDILEILAWSQVEFGEAARRRYEQLIVTGLLDIAADPIRPGSQSRPELGEAVRSWHLRGSRERAVAKGGLVRRPRPFLIYRPVEGQVAVGRILHDSMELRRQLGEDRSWY